MTTKSAVRPLPVELLRRVFDPARVPYETTDEAQQCAEPVLGQGRAKEALDFGLGMPAMDYHVFVAGPTRTGKTHLVRTFVERIASEQPVPNDWVYVHNFKQPDQPRALSLPPGQGRVLAKAMEKLVTQLSEKIPATFESEDYAHRREDLVNQYKRRRTEVFQEMESEAEEQGYALRFEPTGIAVTPTDSDGQPLGEQQIKEMSDEQREELRQRADGIQGMVTERLRKVGAMEKELQQKLQELDLEMVLGAVGGLFTDLKEQYAELPETAAYLEEVQEDIVENFERFKKKEAGQQPMPFPVPQAEPSFTEYQVNVFVDHSASKHAPVVVETNPTHPNLFGRMERQAQFGALLTDFTMLKAGALHQANGGYLVIPVLELLRYGLPYEALKRALLEQEVKLEDVMEMLGYIMTRSLKPQPIPLKLKVILVGETRYYHLLYTYDPQFPKLFKVRAQLTDQMHWDQPEIDSFMSHLCGVCKDRGTLPLHRGAVARLLELGAELADDRERLTLRMALVEDVVKEANLYATKNGHQAVMAEDVEMAVEKRRYRSAMIDERMQEAIVRGFFNVATEGEALGQINGLAVYSAGDFSFGKPARISCGLGLGKPGLVSIDREVDMAGPIHNKGLLILTGFLKERFAVKAPLTLSASLAFEQSYGMIDGDSASLAETLALISRLSGLPIRQDLAVTGSVSQRGQVQAIGGVNQKVEGFFRLCQERGLTGTQGVAIPESNCKNLMLHPMIVEACRQGKFHIYPLKTVEEGVELFMGKKAGERSKTGNFPRGTAYYLVEKELDRQRDVLRKLSKKEKAESK